MNYAIINEKDLGIVQYAYYLLEHLAKINGHNIVNIEKADYILYSICDVTQILQLGKIRNEYKNKKIIVGGHFSVYFKLCSLFADYVIVGQGFEFFKCKTLEEIKELKCCYYEGSNKIIEPSILIEWGKVPLCKITKNSFYYWNSVGCKNKCKFCLTSWTNKYQCNDKKLIQNTQSKKMKINYISNENDNLIDIKEQRKSIMLKDFLNITKHYCNYYRIGLEFANEENRKKNGKYFTDAELYESMKKAVKDKIRIQYFCIGGYEVKEDWYKLFANMPALNNGWEIKFKFTNLEYQIFTPLFKELKYIDVTKYLYQKDMELIFNKYIKHIMKPGRVEKIKYPAHALWRTGMTNSINKSQFEIFYNLRNEKNINVLHNAIMENEIYNNDYSNEIRFWYQK